VALGGATEAAIWSNFYEVDRVEAGWRSIPYGAPLPNQVFRVVDDLGRDCPDWVDGELWIGGSGLARGYRGDEVATATRFVSRGGRRWYRTGDSGRYWPDGTLEILGRIDHQLKVGGHRVEPGEIEAALRAHPSVAEAVVVAAGGLVGFVVPRFGFDAAEVMGFLSARLPPYLVPERLATLDRLPLNANGKVDREQLRDRPAPPAPSGEPPRGELEQVLADLWAELLGVAPMPRDASFFALGGDSLSAVRLAEALRQRRGVELPLREIFAAPTIAGLAERIAAQDHEEGTL
jgi:acyl-coenzyme A synthetase/AMP-(fatty) acid ligase/acyl carrier protein